MTSADPHDDSPITPASARRPVSGLEMLCFAALGMIVLLIVGGVVLAEVSTDPGFRTSAMEQRVRAGLPSGWTMKVTGSSEHTGPCIDGCDGSSLDVTFTSSDRHASRAVQQRELAQAMHAGGWGYHAPLTRAQELAFYERDNGIDPDIPFDVPDDETIGFHPTDAGLFEGGPESTRSTVSYQMTAQWLDGQFSLTLSASQGD